MENRNLGIILTLVTMVLCGIPGLVSICSGIAIAFNNQNFADPAIGVFFALSLLCTGLCFAAIPVVAGFLTHRNRTQAAVEPLSRDEPIPPPN
jgi:hypothetical protein